MYGINSAVSIFPADAITMETAGFMCPPDILLANNITNANAAPIAMGLPVAKIMYTKNNVPENSAKYLYRYYFTRYFYNLINN